MDGKFILGGLATVFWVALVTIVTVALYQYVFGYKLRVAGLSDLADIAARKEAGI